jgi:type I restriction enzyme M protein
MRGSAPAVPNERVTEGIVRDHLTDHGIDGQTLVEQTSDDPRIRKALARASKAGAGSGKPEFILTLPEDPDLVIVVECKASLRHHQSAALDKPATHAVDGVLLYAAHLSADFDVIAIAASGTDLANLRVSSFRQLRGSKSYDVLEDIHGPVEELRPVADYRRLLTFDSAVRRRAQDDLMAFSRELHNYMRDYAKLSENEKPLAVSGVLLALQDPAFNVNWRKHSRTSLGEELLAAIRREIESAIPQTTRRRVVLQPYQFIETHPELNKKPQGKADWPLRELVSKIDEHVRPFIDVYEDVDVIGHFYAEFLRYTGGDKKGLGIVLTPRHLTELFVKMADVGVNDTVIDTCCGSGGFLIASLGLMDAKAGDDKAAREAIRAHRLVGVEQQPQMFALAASNMILRGDGKANLYQGSCFDEDIVAKLRDSNPKQHERPTIGLINPPFAQKGAGLHELDFVDMMLDVLQPGGLAVAVVPMSCGIEQHPTRTRILSKHTLVACVSLPVDLFDGVICIGLVFRAQQAHAQAPAPTWFGLWKDDGFAKRKPRGRVDDENRWPGIRDHWLEMFHSRQVLPGISVTHKVGASDEWTAEAYLEADYSSLTRDDFEKGLRQYLIFEAVYGSADP